MYNHKPLERAGNWNSILFKSNVARSWKLKKKKKEGVNYFSSYIYIYICLVIKSFSRGWLHGKYREKGGRAEHCSTVNQVSVRHRLCTWQSGKKGKISNLPRGSIFDSAAWTNKWWFPVAWSDFEEERSKRAMPRHKERTNYCVTVRISIIA